MNKFRKNIIFIIILAIFLFLLLPFQSILKKTEVPNSPKKLESSIKKDSAKVGLTQSMDFALMKMNINRESDSIARGVAIVRNTSTLTHDGNFEISILDRDNKTTLFKLYGSVKGVKAGEESEVEFKSNGEHFPDFQFIFGFRTISQ